MGCGQLNATAVVNPSPNVKQHSQTVAKENPPAPVTTTPEPQNKSPAVSKVEHLTQVKHVEAKKLPPIQKHQALPPLKQASRAQTSAYTKNQLYHPEPNESHIVEILKDKPQQKNLFQKAEQLSKKQQYAQALKLYKKIEIEDIYIYTQRGFCNYQQQIYEKALEEYTKCLKLKSDHMPTYFRLSLVYYFKEDYNKSLELLQKCLTLDQNPQIYYRIGLSYYYKEDYDKSMEFYKKAFESNNKNSELLKGISDCYFYKEDYKQAINWLNKIVQLQPKNAKILSQIGYCYYSTALYPEANTWYEKSLVVNAKDVLTYYRQGQNYCWMQDYDAAIEKFEKCVQLDPKNQTYLIQIGDCLRFQELYEESIQTYKKALKINSKNATIYCGMACAYYELEQNQQAISSCKKGIKVNPQQPILYLTLGDCYYQDENYKTAIENYKIALTKKPQNIPYYNYMIAKCYYFNQQQIQALPFFKEAVRLSPTNLLYQVQHGKCLFQMQNFSESFKVFTKAKQIYLAGKHNSSDQGYKDVIQEDTWVSELNQFIQSAAMWQQKKKIGYVSPQDKEEIKKMRKNFEKKYQAIFGVQSADKKEARTKPVDKQFLEVASHIHKDKFSLDTRPGPQSPIFKIAALVRNIYNYDMGSFQIFAYIFQEFMWLQKFEFKKSISQIQDTLNKVLQMLSDKYPPVAKSTSSPEKPVEFPAYKQIKLNLFTQVVYFEEYDMVVHQIQKINVRAKNDLAPFKEFVYTLQKNYQGNHAKVGMKLPQKKENMNDAQKDKYQQSLFKVLMRIFQKMFKEIAKKKEDLLENINKKIGSGKKLPLYAVNQIIMSTWIESINEILSDRKQNGIKTECYITDLVRGKCMFQSISALQKAANGVISMCKEKGYQIMQLDNRLLKITQDIVFKIKIKEVVSELQLALQFDTVAFEFGHNFYQIQRCPLGCIFGSSLFLTKDVSESFLKQVANSIESVKAVKPVDKQGLKSLEFVMDSFKQSSKSHRFF